MLFAVERSTVQDRAVLHVHGELDIATAAELAEAVEVALLEAPPGLVLDLSPTVFVDSSGCRQLAVSARRAASRGVDAVVVCPGSNTHVRLVLDMVELRALVPVLDALPS